MDGGFMYLVAVEGWTPGSLATTEYQVFLANLPPYNGYCEVTPKSGQYMQLATCITLV